jgi:hypothetical protein
MREKESYECNTNNQQKHDSNSLNDEKQQIPDVSLQIMSPANFVTLGLYLLPACLSRYSGN